LFEEVINIPRKKLNIKKQYKLFLKQGVAAAPGLLPMTGWPSGYPAGPPQVASPCPERIDERLVAGTDRPY